jgi:hypothetical protein
MKTLFTAFAMSLLLLIGDDPRGLLAQQSAPAPRQPSGGTAQQALAILDNYAPGATSSIISMTGDDGRVQPPFWEVVLLDPRSTSGKRVIRIADGRVYYDQTPSALLGGPQPRPTLAIQRFHINSDRAFAIANAEAQKAQAQFNHIDYELYPGSPENMPLWMLTLVDSRDRIVGKVHINAGSGLVLDSRWNQELIAIQNGQVPPDGGGQPLEKVGRSVDNAVDRVGDSLKRLFSR